MWYLVTSDMVLERFRSAVGGSEVTTYRFVCAECEHRFELPVTGLDEAVCPECESCEIRTPS